jgi:hypothetical protein
MEEWRRRLRMEGNTLAVVVVLSLLAVTFIASLLIFAGKDIANGIIAATQPDALANGWLVVATAFVTGVAPLIALGAAVGRALAGGPKMVTFRNTIEEESDTGDEGNQGSPHRRSGNSFLAMEPVVSATAVAAIVQLFVLISGIPDVSTETQAAIVAGLTALAGLYIRQKTR